MVYKKVYDENKGIYIYVDPWTLETQAKPSTPRETTGSEGSARGRGIFDALASVGQKIFSSSVKEASKKALETAGKQALESGAKKIGTEVGNLAANKVANVIKGKPVNKPLGEMIVKELKKDDKDINMRVNKLLSGSGKSRLRSRAPRRVAESNIQMRLNKLLLK